MSGQLQLVTLEHVDGERSAGVQQRPRSVVDPHRNSHHHRLERDGYDRGSGKGVRPLPVTHTDDVDPGGNRLHEVRDFFSHGMPCSTVPCGCPARSVPVRFSSKLRNKCTTQNEFSTSLPCSTHATSGATPRSMARGPAIGRCCAPTTSRNSPPPGSRRSRTMESRP